MVMDVLNVGFVLNDRKMIDKVDRIIFYVCCNNG